MEKTVYCFWSLRPFKRFQKILITSNIIILLLVCGSVTPAYSLGPEDIKNSFNDNPVSVADLQQQINVSGTVNDASTGEAMGGVNIQVKGTTIGVASDAEGKFAFSVPDRNAILVFSFIGYVSREIPLNGRTSVNVALESEVLGLEEVIVVGYGTQKRSDITGTVASIPKERLEKAPNLNIAQAIQGSIPGVMIKTSSAGASPTEDIMIRGRNSIKASNKPLIVVDGLPYEGNIRDINPNDVLSIEVLKDASAAAIYGSRGANGVLLVTTKGGSEGKITFSYDGFYSVQNYSDLPDIMDGSEFYDFKMTRTPIFMTLEEKAIYEAGAWVDYYDLILRKGRSQQHNLSVSGGSKVTKYYISGTLLDVKGLTINDDYLRATNRINIESKITPWLTIGTRSQYSYEDQSGDSPSWSDAYSMNPLSEAYDVDGKLTIYPMKGQLTVGNPLQDILFENIDQSSTILTNTFAIIDFPFIKGLSYRLNAGFSFRFSDEATYRGRNTLDGLTEGGSSDTERSRYNTSAIENILSYNRNFGKHAIFGTALYSFEGNKNSSNSLSASRYPNDFLTWYASAQAEVQTPGYTYSETNLISQMLRLNYTYDSRYLITLTSRRDGFSGFGADTKWGVFPSVAIGWNLANESFFPFKELLNEFKIRASWGLNGNQAVGPYETISRLEEYNMVDDKIAIPGYRPSVLGQDNLGWESSRTINLGLDFGVLANRISGNINLYKTKTFDLLLDRTISPIQGITSITQNIGETQNAGIELSLNSRNIVWNNFIWSTNGNLSFNKNKILSLYGILDEEGHEVDDIANGWFIGQPINVNYDFKRLGTWQLDETEEAAKWNSKPGYVKIEDVNGDYKLDASDKQFIGQHDPTFLWGMTNSFSYKNVSLSVFVHGVHGATAQNTLMTDNVTAETRNNTMKKNWWTEDNPTNEWVMNNLYAEIMGGINLHTNDSYFQNQSFIRIKDISLSYNLPLSLIKKIGIEKVMFYITGRNMFTFTEWIGTDPELSSQRSTPLQKEYVFGLNLSF